jgi:DNA-binding transcriptional MerR regulator
MGRERRFSANEAILIAIAAELTKLGLSIAVAARVVDLLNGDDPDGFWPRVQHEDGWLLIIAPSPAPAGVDAPSLMPAALFRPKTPELESLAELRQQIREKLRDPASVVIADVSVIARRTLRRLE